ncbi:unnamed protein product [Rotaria sp. Silwood1]|nr:unnamed protein product [Rotaria sp. Silwood1]
MEYRLVLNNRSDVEITNNDMSGKFHQQLKYYKYRRVPSKNGKAIFYLFFRKEEETYAALRAAQSIKEISLVRYYPSDHINSESTFRPFPPQQIIDICRYAFRNRLDNFYHVMNGSISIILPVSTIILQFPVAHQQNNQFTIPCVHCGQCNLLQTNDEKEEKEDMIEIKDDVIEIKDDVMHIKEEKLSFGFEMDEYILHKDPNLYINMFSPISIAESEGVENKQSSLQEDKDENLDFIFKKCCNDISEIVQYLKEDIILNMKRQINSTTVKRVAKRAASDELEAEAKKVMVDHHVHEKQASTIVPKSFDQPKFVSAIVMANSARTNVQIIPDISDEELLAYTVEFEKKNH